ncbi:MAG: FG-GAP repeat protein, partial [Planctomycetota bacterium]
MKKSLFFEVALIFCIFCGPAFAGWEPFSKLKAPDPCEGARFGFSVSTDGGFVAISAPWKNSDQGAVYIYEVNDFELEYTTMLLPPDLNDTSRYGYQVCIDSNRLVVGSYSAD